MLNLSVILTTLTREIRESILFLMSLLRSAVPFSVNVTTRILLRSSGSPALPSYENVMPSVMSLAKRAVML